jgi:hypothetical protein
LGKFSWFCNSMCQTRANSRGSFKKLVVFAFFFLRENRKRKFIFPEISEKMVLCSNPKFRDISSKYTKFRFREFGKTHFLFITICACSCEVYTTHALMALLIFEKISPFSENFVYLFSCVGPGIENLGAEAVVGKVGNKMAWSAFHKISNCLEQKSRLKD